MAMHILENEYLKVMVADAGAELSSVFDKETEEERLWNADPAVWNRHAILSLLHISFLIILFICPSDRTSLSIAANTTRSFTSSSGSLTISSISNGLTSF